MALLKPPFPFPFPPLPSFAQPAWATDEMQRRVVLLLNHITQQEPQAMQRLVAHKGRIVSVQWRSFNFPIRITPAGLFDTVLTDVDAGVNADLQISITHDSPFAIAQMVLQGNKPPLRIEGDAAFAADINWVIAHVRWDVEEDLARILGDTAAHTLARIGRSILKGRS